MADHDGTVLLTGVAGFIGSNLANALLRRGYSVVGMDNMSQGSELNLKAFRRHPHFSFHVEDIRDEKAVTRLARGCQAIVHLAAFKIPRYQDALDTLTINAHGSENVARAAAQHGARVVAASTSDVYGKNPEVPFSEESNLVMGNPDVRRWAYAISKMYDEQLFFAYGERYGLEVVLLRFFGGYGPNQNLTWWGGPQSVFINNALDDLPLEIHGDGQQTRSFTYVDDLVQGIILALENRAAKQTVFNIGDDREITIEALARLVWQQIRGGQTPKITFVPYNTFGKYEDVRRRIPDTTKARTILGFRPTTDLETGLLATIRWQQERRREATILEDLKAA